MTAPIARRRALAAVATVGLTLPVLASCGGDDDPGAGDDAGAGQGDDLPTGNADPTPGSGTTITATKDVPVGGGTILPDQELVVTQPTKGEFHCFTAVCTHMGCIVSSVQLGGIRCECHGSAYSIEDGTPVNPPATEALQEFPVTVNGGQVTIA
jgi:nitrite reductase/ring-hydroxylating ferredoxin subunit